MYSVLAEEAFSNYYGPGLGGGIEELYRRAGGEGRTVIESCESITLMRERVQVCRNEFPTLSL